MDVELITYEGMGHVRLAASLASPLAFIGVARRDMLTWFGRHANH